MTCPSIQVIPSSIDSGITVPVTIDSVITLPANQNEYSSDKIDHLDLLNIGTTNHADIDIDLIRLTNTSGTNTGDQDLSGKEDVGVAAYLDSLHVAAPDPHPQYLTSAEGGAAYAPIVHGHPLSQLTQSGATTGQIVYWNGTSWVPYTQPIVVFNFLQIAPSFVWTITHNLGFYPAVMAIDGTGSVIVGQVFHVSVNQLTITFLISIDGAARLN